MAEMDAQSTAQETQTPTTAESASQASTPAASAQETPAQSSSAAADGAQAGDPAQSTPPWTPNFKFKAGGKEHEIGEAYRGIIKDQATLDEVKRLHEKAYGLDSVLKSRESMEHQLQSLAPKLQEYETVTKNFARLSHFVENGDFDSFFEGLGISEEQIAQWVQHKIELANAPKHVQEAYAKNRQLLAQTFDREQENLSLRSQASEIEKARAYGAVYETVSSLAPDFASAYDAKMGEGAFIEAVINKGVQILNATGYEPPVEKVVALLQDELQRLGFAAQAPQQMQGMQQATQPQAPTGVAPTPKPAIPVIPAGGKSPVQTPIKSMEDLKKRAAAFGV
jgi:hypothetical protein